MRKLIVRDPGGTQRDHPLPMGRSSIGRDPDCDIHLHDSQVSWHHAHIDCMPDRCMLQDQVSTNGTFVDAKRIDDYELQPGDAFKIGPYRISYEAEIQPLSAASASERTLFAVGARHPHRIDEAKDPYATFVQRPRGAARLRPPPLAPKPRQGGPAAMLVPDWLQNFRSSTIRGDAIAGLTVAALLIPQGMAYALLAGLPPIMGLYASILPMILYALTGSGRQTSVAPVALDSILVAIGLGVLAQSGTEAYVALAILLAATIGAIQLIMGLLRMGYLVNFLSYPVLCGFTSAAAIIIAISQLQHILGVSIPRQPHFFDLVREILVRTGQANPVTLFIGTASTAALIAARRWLPKVPGPLAVIVLFTAVVAVLGLERRGVATVGAVPSGLPQISLPTLVWSDIGALLPLALTMSLVGFAQTIAIGKSLGNRYGYDVAANRELTALGLSNVASAVSQGFPVSGGLSRSAVNARAGARTPIAGIFCAFVVVLTVLFLTPLLTSVPNAALAGVIVVSAISLIDYDEIRYLFRVKKTEGLLLVFTFVATLTFGITPGLLLGIVASIMLFISLNTRPNAAILGRLPDTNIFRNVEDFAEAETIPGLMILRIDASFYFANTEFLKQRLRQAYQQHEGELEALILDASSVNDLDSSADTALHQLCAELQKNDVELFIAGVKGPVREVMRRSGLYDALGGDHFFFTIDAAVKRYLSRKAAGGTRA